MNVAEMPPEHVTHRVTVVNKVPMCGRCRRPLQHRKQWRCPYVKCRVWLRSINELEPDSLVDELTP